MGRSISITSWPASRAAVTSSTRSGVRSSSVVRIRVAAITSPTSLDVLARRPEQHALKVMPDQRAAGLEQLVEGLQQAPLGRLRCSALGLDPLAHVAVEQVHRLAGGAVDGGGIVLAQ